MRLIESKAELLEQPSGIEGIYKQIELCGRTCYKSEDKITEDSAKKFMDMLIRNGHLAMLEHGTVYLNISIPKKAWNKDIVDKYYRNPYSKVNNTFDAYDYHYFITTNYRVIIENGWKDDLKYLCDPTELHEKRYTTKFTTDRGVSHELVRHRVFSFAQESTRYCNYSKDKFNQEVSFIIPSWLSGVINECSYRTMGEDIELLYMIEDINLRNKASWLTSALIDCELCYLKMLEFGATPQEARQVLPNALKTEICMTGFESDWKHFFDLRYFGKTGKPHPDMQLLASKAKEEMESKGVWNKIIN